MMLTMPQWTSYMVTTTVPLFSPTQCEDIIKAGHNEKLQEAELSAKDIKINKNKRNTNISWIPFDKLPQMYESVEQTLYNININHFGFEDVNITEPAQFTEYNKDGFYDWHMDLNISGKNSPPVRKISMTILLSDPSTFIGGELEFMEKNKFSDLKQGQAIFFASFIRHRVAPVQKGIRRSLVMWFGGKPFK